MFKFSEKFSVSLYIIIIICILKIYNYNIISGYVFDMSVKCMLRVFDLCTETLTITSEFKPGEKMKSQEIRIHTWK